MFREVKDPRTSWMVRLVPLFKFFCVISFVLHQGPGRNGCRFRLDVLRSAHLPGKHIKASGSWDSMEETGVYVRCVGHWCGS